MPGSFVFCDPSYPPSTNYQTVYFDQTSGALAGTITGTRSSILGGDPATSSNATNGDFNSILMGDTNHINTFMGATPGTYNTIINGQFNTMGRSAGAPLQVDFSTILGGSSNCIDTDDTVGTQHAVIGGGASNRIQAGMDFAAIVGGDSHQAAGSHSFIGGGSKNEVDDCATVGGGEGNRAVEDYAAVFGGFCNHTDGHAAFIGGGACNLIIGNPNHPDCAAIAGGECNNIGATGGTPSFFYDWSMIGGGFTNNILSRASFIGGGYTNTINKLSDCSFISGGQSNNIGAGINGSVFSSIGGGYNNFIDDTTAANSYSGIFGGANHCVQGNNSFIGGGDTNKICSTAGLGPVLCSAIVGGANNIISDNGATTADLAFIGAGTGHSIFGLASSIVGGQDHTAGGRNSFIGGGHMNLINSAAGIPPTRNSAIAGGTNNSITDDGVTAAQESFIGGGNNNNIFSALSSIVGGVGQSVSSPYSFIGGGDSNFIGINSDCSFIGGGNCNCIQGLSSFIGGGGWFDGVAIISHGNCVCGDFGFIGGGSDNFIDSTGSFNTYGVIGGGQINCIFPGTNHSSILNGYQNQVSGSCSAILGGSGNSDGGFNWAGVFGCNVMGVAACAFHSNTFVAQNMYNATGGLPLPPTGTLYYCVTGLGQCTVYIS